MSKIITPGKIHLEASTLCQLHCPCCTTASRDIESGVGFGYLKFSDFKKLLDEKRGAKEIELSNFGEIFLNPELHAIIRYAYEKHVRLYADNGVNFNTVTDEMLECLVKYRFQRLSVSIDGATQQTYQKYRIKGDFNTVIDNIRKLNAYKIKFHTSLPHLIWQFVIFGHNEHEIPAAKKLSIELGMTFHPKLSWDLDFSPVKNPDFVKKASGLCAIDRDEFRKKKGKNYSIAICHQLWEEPQINWDGKVFGCCWNYWKDFGGNVFTDGLHFSLNSEKITYAREMLQGIKPPRDDIPCIRCDLYLEYANEKKWLRRGFARSLFCIAKYWYQELRLERLFRTWRLV